MNVTLRIVGTMLLLTALAGCVTTSKYKKLQTESTALQTQQAKLKAQADSLAKQNAKLQEQTESLTRQNATLQSQSDSLAAAGEALRKSQAENASHYEALVQQLSSEVNSGNLQIKQYQNMLSVNVAEKIFFDSGKADIKESGKKVLKDVGLALAQYPDKIIRVVGHTDSIPISKKTSAFASNWELSAARATTVVRFLQDVCKIPPERLIAVGRAQYQPVAPNDTPENRQKNRRIEIMLIDKSMVEPTAKS